MRNRHWIKGDCHLHTANSDGAKRPEELCEMLYKKGLDFAFITDHNYNTPGEKEFNYKGVGIFPGLEISSNLGHMNVFGENLLVRAINRPRTEEDFRTLVDFFRSRGAQVSVNHPLSFGHYKVYQQTYGTAGSLTTRNSSTGGEDSFVLTEPCFLTTDGMNGLWFEALYPGYIRDADGNYTLITSTSGSYTDPVYQILLAVDGDYTPVLAFPGEELTVGEMEYVFNGPIEYPGLRIKRTPPLVNALLCAAFVLMIAGLYVTFFLQPVLVKTDEEGYTVCGPKPESMRMELRLLLRSDEKTETE